MGGDRPEQEVRRPAPVNGFRIVDQDPKAVLWQGQVLLGLADVDVTGPEPLVIVRDTDRQQAMPRVSAR